MLATLKPEMAVFTEREHGERGKRRGERAMKCAAEK